jgi:hypothetical protein
MTTPAPRDDAWYSNGWVWLIIGIPAATIAGCLLTMYLAIAHPDEIVHDPAPAASPQDRR